MGFQKICVFCKSRNRAFCKEPKIVSKDSVSKISAIFQSAGRFSCLFYIRVFEIKYVFQNIYFNNKKYIINEIYISHST